MSKKDNQKKTLHFFETPLLFPFIKKYNWHWSGYNLIKLPRQYGMYNILTVDYQRWKLLTKLACYLTRCPISFQNCDNILQFFFILGMYIYTCNIHPLDLLLSSGTTKNKSYSKKTYLKNLKRTITNLYLR